MQLSDIASGDMWPLTCLANDFAVSNSIDVTLSLHSNPVNDVHQQITYICTVVGNTIRIVSGVKLSGYSTFTCSFLQFSSVANLEFQSLEYGDAFFLADISLGMD